MFTILLHSSKTMRHTDALTRDVQLPMLTSKANELAEYLKTLTIGQIKKAMQLSDNKAAETYELIQRFDSNHPTLPVLDIFLGDIYSGLQVQTFNDDDRAFANEHLFILSGLYGVLRALDTIQPYRLEMGYKLPGSSQTPAQRDITSLYEYWGDSIARQLPANQAIMNLSAVEYTKALFPYFKSIEGLAEVPIITPKFLTVSPKTSEPQFVTVHAKIARGAFARWLIQERIGAPADVKKFNDLGYEYSSELSTPNEPVFVTKDFKGIGLSVRQKKAEQ